MRFFRSLVLGLTLLVSASSALLAQNHPMLLGVGGPTSAATLTGFTFVASGVGGDPGTVTIPAGSQAGDLTIIWNVATGSAPASVTPSGFTLLAEHTLSTSARAIISAKKLVGGETTVTVMNSTVDRWIVATFRPNTAFTSFTANGVNGEGTGTDPVSQTIAASGATKPTILIGQMFAASGQVVDPRTTSPAMDEIAGTATNHYAHYEIYGTADTPVNTSYDMADEGNINMLQSLYLTFN